MPLTSLSLAVVGAQHPNKRGPTRRFEIELCAPGEPIELRPEPKNPADPRAVAVYSMRGVQLGYLTAERCGWIGSMIAAGREIQAIFQRKASYGAVIRVAFDGEAPALPVEPEVTSGREPTPIEADPDPGFWPDEEWPEA